MNRSILFTHNHYPLRRRGSWVILEGVPEEHLPWGQSGWIWEGTKWVGQGLSDECRHYFFFPLEIDFDQIFHIYLLWGPHIHRFIYSPDEGGLSLWGKDTLADLPAHVY